MEEERTEVNGENLSGADEETLETVLLGRFGPIDDMPPMSFCGVAAQIRWADCGVLRYDQRTFTCGNQRRSSPNYCEQP